MLNKVQNFFIKEALAQQQTGFDRVKIYTLYSIIVFHTVVYLLGSIPLFIGDYPLLRWLQVVGLSFIVLIAIALKQTKNYKIPGIVWMIGGIVYTLFASIISEGSASYLSYAVLMLNILVSFLVLERTLLIFNLFFCTAYSLFTLSVNFGYLPKLDFGLNLVREKEFLSQSNIFPIVLIILMISYIVWVYARSHQKAINTIAEQRITAMAQQEEITAKSITYENSTDYAVEIQKSILAQSRKFDIAFNDHFVYFKPKTKLSSNFYWVIEKDGLLYFALMDTTEGGVSGAILSIICQNGLRKAVQELNLTSPAAILEYLGHYVEKTMVKGKQKNGINMSVCTYNREKQKLLYAGAAAPILVMKNGELAVYDGDKSPISKYIDANRFNNTEIKLDSKDVVYLFTDGFASQLGGENNQILTQDGFYRMISDTFNNDMSNQKVALAEKLKEWVGNNEQQDDVCVIGLQI